MKKWKKVIPTIALGIITLSSFEMYPGLNISLAKKVEKVKDEVTISASTQHEYQPNIRTYQTPQGEHTIYWAEGVNPPDITLDPNLSGTEGYFRYEKYTTAKEGEGGVYTAAYEPNKGYFDYNKNKINRPQENTLCYLGTAGNLISWWLEQNKVEVEEYLKRLKETDIYGQYGGLYNVLPYDDKMWTDIRKQPGEEKITFDGNNFYLGQQLGKSPLITKYLNPYYTKTDDGWYSDYVIDFFFNGYEAIDPKNKINPTQNSEDNFVKDERGGFFFPLLGKHRLVDVLKDERINYDYCSENLKKYLSEGKGIGLAYNINADKGHAITVWGAEYDEKGNLCRVYITDTDDDTPSYYKDQSSDKYLRGLNGLDVHKMSNGKMRLDTIKNPSPDKKTNPVKEIYVLDLAKDLLQQKLNDTAEPQKPIVTENFQDGVYAKGAKIQFEVKAQSPDNGDIEYKWYVSNDETSKGELIPIEGVSSSKKLYENKPILNLNLQELGTKYYYCVVENIKNGKIATYETKHFKVETQDIELVNAQTPKITFDSRTEKRTRNEVPKPIQIQAEVTDGGTLTYQWYLSPDNSVGNGTPIKGETNSYIYPYTDREACYYCIVTNTNNSPEINGSKVVIATSRTSKRILIEDAQLENANIPVIVKKPESVVLENPGEEAILSVEAKVFDKGNITYQWCEINEDDTIKPILNETNKTFKPNTSEIGIKRYKCEIKNTNNNATNKREQIIYTDVVTVEVKGKVIISKDNNLKKLELKNGTLNPNFDPNIIKYSTTIPHGVEKLEFDVAADPKAKILTVNPTIGIGETKQVVITVEAEDKSEKVYTIDVTRSPEHKYGKWKIVKQATCTEKGQEKRVCEICGHEEISEIEALGHDWNTDWTIDKEATCTKKGEKSHHCKRCEAKNDITEIETTEHKYGKWKIVKQATCTEKGQQKRVCEICGHEEISEIEALGHDWNTEWTIDKEATCTKKGEKSHHCKRCEAKNDITEIETTEHKYGKWEIVKQATCTEKGQEKRVCEICGHEEISEIEALGHDWNTEWTIDKEATCTEKGEKSHHCKRCDERKDIQEFLLDHDFGDWEVIKDSTGMDEGIEQRVCKSCGKIENRAIPRKDLAEHEYNHAGESVMSKIIKISLIIISFLVIFKFTKIEISKKKK